MSDRRKASHITYETEEEVRTALVEVLVFLFFVCVTTFIAISLQTIYSFYFNRTMDRLFSKRVSNQMDVEVTFEQIATIEEFWSFLLTTFFQNLRGNWEIANNTEELSSRRIEARIAAEQNKMIFLGQNLILEAPRLRQIRLKPEPCYKHEVFKDLYHECYGSYKKANEYREPEFKGTRYFSLENNSVMPLWGNLERYYGAGYVSFLTYDQVQNEATVSDLRDNDWIDRASRLVMIEMVAYNNNMDLFNNMKFVAELMPNGGIVSYSHMEVAPLFSVWSSAKPTMLAANIIFYGFIIFNTGNEIYEIYRFGLQEYLKSVWNYIDWGIICMAYFALVLSTLHGHFIDEYLDDVFDQRYDKLSSIDKACHWFAIYVSSMATLSFLVWIRIFRFISFNKTMLAFYLALKQCARDIFGFAIILFIIYMAFALLGLAVFGTSNLDFSTFQYAYFFMMRLMLHDFEYLNFQRSDPIWGQLYFMAYIVVVVFLLFNMFLAIISQTYINVKKDAIENPSAIKTVFIKIWNQIITCLKTINKKLSAKPRLPATSSRSSLSSEYVSSPSDSDHKPSDERVHPKKIQFQDSIGSHESQEKISSIGDRNSPRAVSEDEALKEYFGVRRASTTSSPSLHRSVSDYSASAFETPESSLADFLEEEEELFNESVLNIENAESFDFLAGLSERVKNIEAKISELSDNVNRILLKVLEAEKPRKFSQDS